MATLFKLYCQNEIPKDFLLITEILSVTKLGIQRNIIMKINSMLYEMIYSKHGASSIA